MNAQHAVPLSLSLKVTPAQPAVALSLALSLTSARSFLHFH